MEVYNPGLLQFDDLENPIVCHKPIVDRLLSDISNSESSRKPRHFLIRALPGMGKSTLIHYLGQTAHSAGDSGQNWFPLNICQDHFEICSLRDFLDQTLLALKAYLSSVGDIQALETFEENYKNLPGRNDQAGLQLLLDSVERVGKCAVLLIDDIDDLLMRIKSKRKALFEIIQSHSYLRIVGTSSLRLQDSGIEEAIASQLFNLIELDRLEPSESLNLLQKVAEAKHYPNVVSELNHPNRSATKIIELSGGNIRTLRILFPLLLKINHESPVEAISEILDRITPWYRARCLELSPKAQPLFQLLALNDKPMTVSDMGKALNDSENRILAALKELLALKFVGGLEPDKSLNNKYFVSEKLFGLWFSMRKRDSARPAAWLVHFLKLYFDSNKREQTARNYLLMPPNTGVEVDYAMALAQSLDNDHLRQALLFSVLQASVNERSIAKKSISLGETYPLNSRIQIAMQRMRNLNLVRQQISTVQGGKKYSGEWFLNNLLGSPSLSENEKIRIGEKAHTFSGLKWEKLDHFLSDENSHWRKLIDHHAIYLYKAIASGLMGGLTDIDGAQITSEQWQDPIIAAVSFDAWLETNQTPSSQEIERIDQVYRRAIQADDKIPLLWCNLGSLQQSHLRQYKDAEDSFRRAVSLGPTQVISWTLLGNLLKRIPGRLTEAENAYRKILVIEPYDPNSYNNLAWFLYQYKRDTEEAKKVVDKALELNPDHIYSFHTLATLLVREGNWSEAVPYIRRFVRGLDSDFSPSTWTNVISLFQEIIKINKCAETISLLKECSDNHHWWAMREALAANDSQKERQYIKELPEEIRSYSKELLDQLNNDSIAC